MVGLRLGEGLGNREELVPGPVGSGRLEAELLEPIGPVEDCIERERKRERRDLIADGHRLPRGVLHILAVFPRVGAVREILDRAHGMELPQPVVPHLADIGWAAGGDRTEEVRVAQQILQSIGIRSFTPQVTACPGCGRTTSTFFQEMAEQIQSYLREQMPSWKGRYVGVEEMKLAVMGCVVNGPGESKHANIGISLPGTFEEPKAPVYVDGRLFTTLKGDRIVAEFIEILDEYVDSHYAAKDSAKEEVPAKA